MDNYKVRKLANSVDDVFARTYDPTTDLDPEVAAKIRALSPEQRPQAVDTAFDEAGAFAKLKRMIGAGYKGDIYGK